MKIAVLSLGGSIIVPDKVDYGFLKEFKRIILKVAKKEKVVICTGGGKTAREYIEALERESLDKYNRDRIGIAATRLNAQLVSSFILGNPHIPVTLKEVRQELEKRDVVICGGLRPGITSDGTTAEIARYLKADSFINITNVRGLYDKDPRKYKDAKFIPRISYREFAKIMAKVREKPGQHFILDSLASTIIQKSKIKVAIIGKDLKNLENCILGRKFAGTIIN